MSKDGQDPEEAKSLAAATDSKEELNPIHADKAEDKPLNAKKAEEKAEETAEETAEEKPLNAKKAEDKDEEKAVEMTSLSKRLISTKELVEKENSKKKSVSLKSNSLQVKRESKTRQSKFGTFTKGIKGKIDGLMRKKSSKTDDATITLTAIEKRNQTLIAAIEKSDVAFIQEYKDTWNFYGTTPARITKVTPLSMLCRPQLCDCLKEIDEDGQLRLIEHALRKGADPLFTGFNEDGTPNPNERALTDTVYQGDVSILQLFLRNKAVTKEHILEYRLWGASLLHMACYDSRLDMIRFLVEECNFDPNIHDSKGQSPLFWVFARGPVLISCANYLLDYGCDPKEMVEMIPDPKTCPFSKPVYLSPLSLAIGTFPEFVEDYLKQQRQVVSNRGLSRTVRFQWQNLLVSKRQRKSKSDQCTEYFYEAPKFALQVKLEKKRWDTLEYDKDPMNQLSYVEMMIHHRQKDLLKAPVLTKATFMMWELHSKWAFYKQAFAFGSMWVMVTISTAIWPYRGTGPDEIFADVNATQDSAIWPSGWDLVTKRGEGNVGDYYSTVAIWIMGSTMPCLFYLWYIEICEITTGNRWRQYIREAWNWADGALNLSILSLFALQCQIITINAEEFLQYDRAFTCLAVFVHIMLCTKGIQFLSVPAMTGPMVSMMFLMWKNIFQFLCLFFFLWFGFAQAFWMIWKNASDDEHQYYDTYLYLWIWMLGDGVGDFFGSEGVNGQQKQLEEQLFGGVLHIAWVLTMTIMLLNMLIAMMGDTYSEVADEQKAEVLFKRVENCQTYWLSCSSDKNQKFLERLWNESGNNKDEDAEEGDYMNIAEESVPKWAEEMKEDLSDQLMEIKHQLAEIREMGLPTGKGAEKKRQHTTHQRKRKKSILHIQERKKAILRLDIHVIQAKGLRKADVRGKSDPYVIVETRKGDMVLLADRTQTIMESHEPVWQYQCSEMYIEDFDNICFTVMDEDASFIPQQSPSRNKKGDLLGQCVITREDIESAGEDGDVVGKISGWHKIDNKEAQLEFRITFDVDIKNVMEKRNSALASLPEINLADPIEETLEEKEEAKDVNLLAHGNNNDDDDGARLSASTVRFNI